MAICIYYWQCDIDALAKCELLLNDLQMIARDGKRKKVKVKVKVKGQEGKNEGSPRMTWYLYIWKANLARFVIYFSNCRDNARAQIAASHPCN